MQAVPKPIIDAIQSIHLPTMPQVLLRFLRMTEDDRASMQELAVVVGQDPALSAHVLIAANSVACRRRGEFKSLDQCLVALGTRLVRTMAACLAVQSVFARTVGDPSYDLAGFWHHSLRVADLSRAVAVRLGRPDAEEAYLAGLLHDVGQLLLLGGMGRRYGALLAWSSDEEALLALERPELGTDHAVVGAWLVDQWRLSSFMADAVLFHHRQPGEIGGADPLSRIVWAAHAASGWESAAVANGQSFEASAIEAMLGLPAASFADIHRQSFERVAELAAALGVNAATDAKSLPISPDVPFEQSWQTDCRQAQEQLEAKVRDMAILQPLQQNLLAVEDEAAVLQAVRESARILFGLERVAFLLMRDDGMSMAGGDIAGPSALLQHLEIALKAEGSLAAATALGEGPRSTFNAEQSAGATLVDVQVARALGGDGVLYVPLRGRERLLGVMAYGLGEAQYARCVKRLAWIDSFAQLAAVGIEARRDVRLREQKLAAELTGRFAQQARRVAHEAGNPLAIITNYLKIVAERLPDRSDVRHELDILKEEIDRVALIVRHLGSAAPPDVATGGGDTVDVNAVVEGMAALYRESLFSGRGITLTLALDPEPAVVLGSRDQLKQVLLNLWKNAAEAMSTGGRFFVSTGSSIRQNGRDYVELRLVDTGSGLPADVVENIFQPLAPDRRPGHAGMGLSIVATLIKGLDGQVTYQTRPGQGTTFVILLPKAAGSDR